MLGRPVDDWPMVGRDPVVEQAWELLSRRPRQSVVLIGEAGIGKSRIAAAVSERAAASGWTVHRANGSVAASTIPFGAMAALLPQAPDDDPLSILRSALETLTPAPTEAPTLLWVDDGHLLDAGSATLASQLGDAEQVRVLVTVRSGAQVHDAIEQLGRGGRGHRLDIGPMDAADTSSLLHLVLGPPVAASTAQRLWRRSAGNPMLLRELVRASVHSGALSDASGAWLLDDATFGSAVLTDLVRHRIGGLDPSAERVLELLALADALSPSELAQLVPEADLIDLEDRELITVVEDGRRLSVRLSHPLYGDVIRQDLPTLRRRREHGRLIDVVSTSGARRRDDELRIGAWSLDSDHDPPPTLLAAAARQALARFDLELGERLAEASVRNGGGVPALVTLGDIRWRRGRLDDALAALDQAQGLATTESDVAEVANSRSYVLDLAGRSDEARRALREAAELVGPEQRDLLDSQAAILAVLAGRADESLSAVNAVLAAHEGDRSALDLLVRMRVDFAEAYALALLGRFDDAVQSSTDAAAFVAQHPETQTAPELVLLGRVLAWTWAGHLEAARADAESAERVAAHLGDRDAEWTTAFYRGRVSLAAGALAPALEHFTRAHAVAGGLGDAAGIRWSLAGRLLCAALTVGDPQCTELSEELSGLPPSTGGLFDLDMEARARAWAHVCAGRLKQARLVLGAAADAAGTWGQYATEVTLRHDLVRLGDDAQGDRLTRLAAACPGPWPEAVAVHAQAAAGGRAEELASAAEQLADCGARIEAAEAAVAASGAFRRAGRPREATAWGRRAHAWLEVAPDARTPGLVTTPDATPLTPREREISLLAADQLSAAEIAERLHLSRRTVENHLQRIYTKLGISTRAELTEVLGR